MKNECISTTHKSVWDSTTGWCSCSPPLWNNPVWIPGSVLSPLSLLPLLLFLSSLLVIDTDNNSGESDTTVTHRATMAQDVDGWINKVKNMKCLNCCALNVPIKCLMYYFLDLFLHYLVIFEPNMTLQRFNTTCALMVWGYINTTVSVSCNKAMIGVNKVMCRLCTYIMHLLAQIFWADSIFWPP